MKFHGFGRLPIASLAYDQVKMAEHVATVDRHRRYLYPKPIVHEERVVAGHKSLAQQIVLLPPGAAVSVVAVAVDEGDEAVLLEVESAADDQGATKAESGRKLVDHFTKQIMSDRPELREHGQGGRFPSARGIAREWAADLMGVQPSTVARYDIAVPRAPSAPPFELHDWDLPYSQELLDRAIQWRKASTEAIEHQKAVVKSLAGTPWQSQAAEHLEWLEGQVPEAICPYCKAWGALQIQCEECHATGLVGRDALAMSAVFVRLWKTDEYWGRDRNKKWVPLKELRG